MALTDTISPAQEGFIRSLGSDRLATLRLPSVDAAIAALNLPSLTKGTASVLIERLKGMPKDPDTAMPAVVAAAARSGKGNRPGACTTCGHTVDQGAGYYYLANSGRWAVHHAAGECPAGTAPAPVEVTEGLYKAADGTIVLVYTTRNNRLAGKTKQGRSFRYQQGAVALAATGQPVTAAEAAAYGHTHGNCIACSRDLTDDRSLAVGYGPVCANKYGWPWG
jgi:hypothetical protein